MNNNGRKLLYLLKYKYEKGMLLDDKDSVKKIINQIKNNNLDIKLINYLYCYLYSNCVNKKISVYYENECLYLLEVSPNSSKTNYIVLDNSNFDIKRISITISNNTIKKQVHYAIDSNIDFIYAQTNPRDISKSKNLKEEIEKELNKDDLDMISVINTSSPLMYETTDFKNGEAHKYSSMLIGDEMVKREYQEYSSDNIPNNVCNYTKNIYSELALACSISNEYEKSKKKIKIKNDYK